MAKSSSVWGIDIGQCSLKALRCSPDPSGQTIVADAFDYIEYPKILSQPDADPDQLIKEALEQFLSRNELKGDQVAISVSGQAGLSRFFKPPPVNAKTLPDIVKYEARQQIPFALEDVIWDFQQIGGTVIDGLTIDAEIGLFAMKRDAVFRALQPFTDSDIEIDIVQLSPVAVYNVILKDILKDVPDQEDVDPTNPPESIVVLSMGTDATDLIITDGIKLWLRSIPIGGNHFTKQLSRELKLTYAKAEHLKRNARQAEDPKTVFQAMRPVFNDLVTEVQRSMSYFQSIDRNARIGHMAILGNVAKLPGLRQYLTKQLGIDIVKLASYDSLSGSSVVGSKPFQENMLSYGVCYGLCLQGLGKGRMKTNLLPPEFLTERMIRAKKPWALASMGALLLACSFNYFTHFSAWWDVNEQKVSTSGETWENAFTKAKDVKSISTRYKDEDEAQVKTLGEVQGIADAVAGVSDGRRLWSEMLSAIAQAIPRDERIKPGMPVDPKVIPYEDRQQVYIEYIESEYFPDLASWFELEVQECYRKDRDELAKLDERDGAAGQSDPAGQPLDGQPLDGQPLDGQPLDGQPVSTDPVTPAGGGWVIELKGHHFYNSEEVRRKALGAGVFLRRTLLKNLLEMKVKLPDSEGQEVEFTFEELGVSLPVVVYDPRPDIEHSFPNPNHPAYADGGSSYGSDDEDEYSSGPSTSPAEIETDEPLVFPAPKYEFVVQFAWQPIGLNERMRLREARLEQAQFAEQEANAEQPDTNPNEEGE